ncbi:PTS fructose transporter subunit IIB [Anaerorhabdus furcosa]|uniref:PTS system, fructose-specific IIB component n=1 Tax=Anaerorhabdus furcosa TaxID=118967 RepID=A0A1T4PX95_9FIRM|nr:fructose PTS transporter subunit IIB [Anaerorhabdus furcosa]SJZ96132.1 PTS system, fructose-specific IIB component [Anaerorhabdus furcosa]
MNIVAITACTVGVAHTYIAQDRLIEAAKKRGHSIYVETQGTIGSENVLRAEDIKNADVVIFAADVAVSKEERFEGKLIVRVKSEVAIKQPDKLLEKIEQKMKEIK